MNLMTKYGQTYRFKASDFVKVLEKYLGKKVLDFVLVNNNWKIPKLILKRYKEEQAEQIKDDLGSGRHYQVIRADLLSPVEVKKVEGDGLKRSILRHDSAKLAKEILKLLNHTPGVCSY